MCGHIVLKIEDFIKDQNLDNYSIDADIKQLIIQKCTASGGLRVNLAINLYKVGKENKKNYQEQWKSIEIKKIWDQWFEDEVKRS